MVSRVLVVEDNPVIREIMLRQIRSFGVNCYSVVSAEEAVELAEFFDLILMDVQLPGISGIEATRRIRSKERAKHLQRTSIVATTASETRATCLAAGMDDFCSKPVKRADLERVISLWISNQPERMRLLG